MKKFNYILLMGTLILACSCDPELELTDPDKTSPEIALSTDENVKSVLVGAYDGLSASALFGGDILRNSELLAANGEIAWSGTFSDPSDVFRKQMITTNGDAATSWIAAYAAINTTNNILSALEVVNEEDRDQVEGEALFIRGVAYFELIKFYAKPYSAGGASSNEGVPIMLVDDRNSMESKARSSVEDVYQLILSDLTTAESQLAEGPYANRATKEAAAAVLSRVYLQMENYEEARDAADRVIKIAEAGASASDDVYVLLPEYASAFNGGTTREDIWDIPVSSVDGSNDMQLYYASTEEQGRGDIEIQDKHLELYEEDDERLALFLVDPVTDEIRTGKWESKFGNVKVIRLAEMYLTRAEANTRLSSAVGADPIDDVNMIRERAGLNPFDADPTLDEILRERHLELAHEGHRLHDLKRLKGTVTEGTRTYLYTDSKLIFPIPQRERNVNTNLTQNDGYGN